MQKEVEVAVRGGWRGPPHLVQWDGMLNWEDASPQNLHKDLGDDLVWIPPDFMPRVMTESLAPSDQHDHDLDHDEEDDGEFQ